MQGTQNQRGTKWSKTYKFEFLIETCWIVFAMPKNGEEKCKENSHDPQKLHIFGRSLPGYPRGFLKYIFEHLSQTFDTSEHMICFQ